jgi:hypothetical protein
MLTSTPSNGAGSRENIDAKADKDNSQCLLNENLKLTYAISNSPRHPAL